MKKILLPMLFIVFISNTFAQGTKLLVIHKNATVAITKETDEEIYIDISKIDSIVPGCGLMEIEYGGKTYHTVQIGVQCWLKENLDIGTMINSSNDQTNNAAIEKYCFDDDVNNCNTYGGLYQWAEAVQYKNGATNTSSPSPAFNGNVQGICPSGWHIPTDGEFQTLAIKVGSDANSILAKEQVWGGTNTSGFSALWAGCRFSNGVFSVLDGNTYFWSSTEYNNDSAYYMFLYYDDISTNFYNYLKDEGYSVRCVKD